MTLCHWVSVCNRLEGSWCLRLQCLVLVYEGPDLLWNIRKHPPNDILSQPVRHESQLHCRVNVRSSIFSRIQATTYRWLRTVLSVTICVQLLCIAVSALFCPWLSAYNCLSLTPHNFIPDHLYATVTYCSLRFVFPWPPVCNCRFSLTLHFLSVTIFVQMLLIADCALFNPWSSVYNCCFSLTLPCFICDHLWYNCCLSLATHHLIPDHLYTTSGFRWLHTVLSVTVCVR